MRNTKIIYFFLLLIGKAVIMVEMAGYIVITVAVCISALLTLSNQIV